MTKTVVAIFDDIAVARQVVEDLVKADFARGTISLLTNGTSNQPRLYSDKNDAHHDDPITTLQGAGFGAVVGGLTGVLLGLSPLGIGLAIATGVTGVAVGAATGGIVGGLIKNSVPEDTARYHPEDIRHGETLVSVQTHNTQRAEEIMQRYGSINIHERSIHLWRQVGWKGFDTHAESDVSQLSQPGDTAPAKGAPMARITVAPFEPALDEEDTTEAMPVMVTALTTDTAEARVAPMARVIIVPFEPALDDEDTAKSLPVIVTASTTDTTIPASAVVEAEYQAEYAD
jgi:uncharacterized protein YcfJ